MNTPIAALYQLWKWIEAENSTEEKPQFNPLQDRMTQYYFDRHMEAEKARG
jgi:glutathionylspermidine synthase